MELSLILPVALGTVLALIGFTLAFRQAWVRRLLHCTAAPRVSGDDEDPLAYALRIGGVMVMAFGVIIAGMFAAFHFMNST